MKYDCNKFLDCVHEQKRMCGSYSRCRDDCPLKDHNCAFVHMGQEEIDILQKWSDEHPEAPKISKRELDFIAMFKWCEDKRIERAMSGYLFIVFDEKYKYSLRNSWFSFIEKGESMTFEELLKLEVED